MNFPCAQACLPVPPGPDHRRQLQTGVSAADDMRYEITPDFPSSTLSPSIECQTLTILHRARRSYQTRPDWAGPAIYCFQRTLAPAPSGLVGDLLLRVDSTWPGSFWSPFIRSCQSGNSGQRTKEGAHASWAKTGRSGLLPEPCRRSYPG